VSRGTLRNEKGKGSGVRMIKKISLRNYLTNRSPGKSRLSRGTREGAPKIKGPGRKRQVKTGSYKLECLKKGSPGFFLGGEERGKAKVESSPSGEDKKSRVYQSDY